MGKVKGGTTGCGECREFAAEHTAPSVQDGVQRGGAWVGLQR